MNESESASPALKSLPFQEKSAFEDDEEEENDHGDIGEFMGKKEESGPSQPQSRT